MNKIFIVFIILMVFIACHKTIQNDYSIEVTKGGSLQTETITFPTGMLISNYNGERLMSLKLTNNHFTTIVNFNDDGTILSYQIMNKTEKALYQNSTNLKEDQTLLSREEKNQKRIVQYILSEERGYIDIIEDKK